MSAHLRAFRGAFRRALSIGGLIVLLALLLTLARPAQAQLHEGWSLTAGAGIEPSRALIGLRTDWRIAERVRLAPSLAVGYADDFAAEGLLPLLFDFDNTGASSWYAGGGLRVAYLADDEQTFSSGGSSTETTFVAIGGVRFRRGAFVELHAPLSGTSDLAVVAGWRLPPWRGGGP